MVVAADDDVPWLSAAEQDAWRAFLHASQALHEVLDRQLQTDSGMPHTYYGILVSLSEAPGGRLRMTDLAASNRHSQSRLSHAMARLEAAGWVRREKCDTDRRQNFAVLTDAGLSALRAAAPGHVRLVRQSFFDALSPEQVRHLAAACQAVLDNLSGCPALAPDDDGGGAGDDGGGCAEDGAGGAARRPGRAGRTAEVNGARLVYEVEGDGPAVVLVHGVALDRRLWDLQVGPLVAAGLQVIRYDLRGFGGSALPVAGEEYHHGDDLAALLAHLGVERAAVVGLSMGGWVALETALLHPEAVGRLVLVDAFLRHYEFPYGWNRNVAAVARLARAEGWPAARELWLADPVLAPALEQPEAAARLRAMIGDYSGWVFLHRDPQRELVPPAVDRLADVSAPTLVVVGDRDLPDFQGIARLAAEGIPGARLAVIAGAGHVPPLEAPGAFNDALLGFLGQGSGGAG